jgi:hypothetical protein
MSTDFVPTPAVLPPTGTPLPDDGDPADAASVDVAFETILNAIAQVNETVAPIEETGSLFRMGGRVIALLNATEQFSADSAQDALVPTVTPTATTDSFVLYEFDLPHGSSLQSVQLRLPPGTPTTHIVGTLYTVDMLTSVSPGGIYFPLVTVLGEETDVDSALVHWLTVEADPVHTVDRTRFRYILQVEGPSTLTDIFYFGVRANVRIPAGGTIDQGAA